MNTRRLALALLLALAAAAAPAQDIPTRVEDGDADAGGVRIPYVTPGDPHAAPVLMIHGFPDDWYSWRAPMARLARDHRVIAIDQHGYNLSAPPDGEQNCQLAH